jgi:hypothetical protein
MEFPTDLADAVVRFGTLVRLKMTCPIAGKDDLRDLLKLLSILFETSDCLLERLKIATCSKYQQEGKNT